MEKIKISKNLKNLAIAFNENKADLFIVGGYVRNHLMQLSSMDIDITSKLTPNIVLNICKKLNYDAKIVNEKLGTILIMKDKEKYEYTCFRTENYAENGSHTPIDTSFTNEIAIDAKRRDFTINAIYYNILSGEIIDFFNGLNDIKNNQIKAILTPKEVFKNDGLRILRLVRFAITYNLKIEKETFKTAKEYNFQLKDISKERIVKELKLILLADLEYNIPHKQDFFKLFNKLNLYQYVLSSDFKKFKLKKDCQFFNIAKDYRYTYFCLLILEKYFNKEPFSKEQILFACHKIFNNKNSNDFFIQIVQTYNLFQYKKLQEIPLTLAEEYYNLDYTIKEFFKIYYKDYVTKIENKINFLKANNTPLNIKELNISSKDFISNNINKTHISYILMQLYKLCQTSNLENKKDKLLLKAIEIEKSYK